MENERQKSPRQIATTEIEKDLDQLGSALQKIDKDLKVFYTEWSEKLDAIVEGITKEIRIYPELSFTKNLQFQNQYQIHIMFSSLWKIMINLMTKQNGVFVSTK